MNTDFKVYTKATQPPEPLNVYKESRNDNLEYFLLCSRMDHVGMLSSFRQVWNFNDDVGLKILVVENQDQCAIFSSKRNIFKNIFLK